MYPLTFGDPIYDIAFSVSVFIQAVCWFFCILAYVTTPTQKTGSLLILMGLYGLYATIADILFNEVTAAYYLLESLAFFSWFVIFATKIERKTAKTINYDNILLCFYKGDKGSFVMRFFELFGLPVRSLCVVAGDTALMLKKTKSGFTIIDSKALLKKRDNYVIVDSGVKHTPEFIKEMKSYENKPARELGFRILCVKGIAPLLEKIGPEFKPKTFLHYNPSIFLGQVS